MRYSALSLAVVLSTMVVAHELPDSPLLERFGEAINQLPKPASPPEAKHVPRVLGAQELDALNYPGTPVRPEPNTTGNPTIDNMEARDRAACIRQSSGSAFHCR